MFIPSGVGIRFVTMPDPGLQYQDRSRDDFELVSAGFEQTRTLGYVVDLVLLKNPAPLPGEIVSTGMIRGWIDQGWSYLCETGHSEVQSPLFVEWAGVDIFYKCVV
jgi:hypothetical protein